jgi:spoIIIJ-associated protein
VDVKGYLGTRKASLKKLALRMAEKAKKNNKPVTVGQMNAYERRIVHMTLKDVAEVRTQSMGEGYYRKLVIFPKKRKEKKNHATNEH